MEIMGTLEKAEKIIRILKSAGYEAYIVGGYIRDTLFHRHHPSTYPFEEFCNDIDITTNAQPQEIVALFKLQNQSNSLVVGKSFGVTLVNMDGVYFDVATFRHDFPYADGRHPHNVTFVDNPREDVLRRDFTINGLLYDLDTKAILDYVDGEKDIRLKVLRFIGDPNIRIKEDHLRMLRAARFAAKYDLHIHPDTAKSIRDNVAFVYNISKERIFDELTKILMHHNRAKGIRILQKLGILKRILPSIEAMIGMPQPKEHHPEGDVFEHTCLTLECLGNRVSRELVWAALLHDVGKNGTLGTSLKGEPTYYGHDSVGAGMAEQILKDLNADNKLINAVVEMTANHMKFRFAKEMKKSKLARFIYRPTFNDELHLHVADCMASNKNLENFRFIKKVKEELDKPKEEVKMPQVITGDDLIEWGYVPGPEFKTMLKETHDYLIEHNVPLIENSKERARLFVIYTYPLDFKEPPDVAVSE